MVFSFAACGGGKDKPTGGSGTADPMPSTSGTEEEPNDDGEDESPQEPVGPADLSWWSSADGFKEFLPYSRPGAAMKSCEDGPKKGTFEEGWWYYITDVTMEDFEAYVDQLVENGATVWKSSGDAEKDAQIIEAYRGGGNITFQTGTSDEDWLLTINFGTGVLGDGPEQISFSVTHYWS